jgi:hypothetical protein
MAALRSDNWQGRIVVGVEAIVLHLDPTGLLRRLLLLAPPPEKDSTDDEESYGYNGNDDGNGSGACSAETFVAATACCRVESGATGRAGST